MKLLTIKELSQHLTVKVKTLYQWSELGILPSLKINGSLRFDLDDVCQWLESCKKGPGSGYNSSIQGRGPRRGGKE